MTPIIAPRILVLEGLYADTADIVTDAGGIGVEASPWQVDKVTQHLKSGLIDGLLLTGGSDVNPARYGQKSCPVTQMPDNTRDFTELLAIKHCRDEGLPVLGICRGSQIMCVSQGGTLTQDIELYREPWFHHTNTNHDVDAEPSSITFRRACQGDDMNVISLHHQCVDFPGQGMRIAARAWDGTPEAIESKDGLMLGVQFHPEMAAYSNPQAFAIFRWLVETAARRRGGRPRAVSFRDASERYQRAIACAYSAWRDDSDKDDEANTQGTESTSAASPGGKEKPEGKHRRAGEPSIPSMRGPTQSEMVRLIESSTGGPVSIIDARGNIIGTSTEITGETCEDCSGIFDCTSACQSYGSAIFPYDTPRSEFLLEQSLHVCPVCHIRFDCIEDCDDHKKFVHPQANDTPPIARQIEERFNERYPDMCEPPAGHPDWEDTDREIARISKELGFDVDAVVNLSDWEDMDDN